ncbi:NAD-dependent epimerase/dehydratase family protein [Candidatus Protofrankia californiensis]|uniref:NAD-dependent epimerase/dehydratase family protein n=1 Tax=Candidatus Protofrankia californiensis TaxID=1839754 RepID=UPI001040FCE8|nr:NAD-dependent epimerase/dehydratase family protein [Candidatus Protofrankia californiensis]
MRVLVTGGTGKVGNAVARAARLAGHEVRVLVRDTARAKAVLPHDLELVTGDVTDPSSLEPAVDRCDLVFNAMGLPEQWLRDESLFGGVNADGSANLARAAAAAGVRRMVHTSTIDVFDAPPGGRFDETRLAVAPKRTAYERSKQRAERAVLDASGDMEIVFANPATVYGPGPAGSASLETLFGLVLRGLLPTAPPGGFGVVFTEGLAQGHLLAAELGRPGQRYIFCDEHATLMQLARTVVSVTGRGRAPVVTMPAGVATAVAAAGEALARVTHRPPLMARGQLQFLLWNAVPDSARAQRELGWKPTPLDEGVRRTVAAG